MSLGILSGAVCYLFKIQTNDKRLLVNYYSYYDKVCQDQSVRIEKVHAVKLSVMAPMSRWRSVVYNDILIRIKCLSVLIFFLNSIHYIIERLPVLRHSLLFNPRWSFDRDPSFRASLSGVCPVIPLFQNSFNPGSILPASTSAHFLQPCLTSVALVLCRQPYSIPLLTLPDLILSSRAFELGNIKFTQHGFYTLSNQWPPEYHYFRGFIFSFFFHHSLIVTNQLCELLHMSRSEHSGITSYNSPQYWDWSFRR